jgi:hypothetical protein
LSSPQRRSLLPGDPEGSRFRAGCAVVLVAIGILLFSFLMGAWSAYKDHKAGKLENPFLPKQEQPATPSP